MSVGGDGYGALIGSGGPPRVFMTENQRAEETVIDTKCRVYCREAFCIIPASFVTSVVCCPYYCVTCFAEDTVSFEIEREDENGETKTEWIRESSTEGFCCGGRASSAQKTFDVYWKNIRSFWGCIPCCNGSDFRLHHLTKRERESYDQAKQKLDSGYRLEKNSRFEYRFTGNSRKNQVPRFSFSGKITWKLP